MIRFIKEQVEYFKIRFALLTREEIIFEVCMLFIFIVICILGVLLNQ